VNPHDILLSDLRSSCGGLVDRALAFEVPPCIADTLDVDDAELAMRRMRMMAETIAASPAEWTAFGAGVVNTRDKGCSARFDRRHVEIRRMRLPGRGAQSSENPSDTLCVTASRADGAARVEIRLPAMALPITTGIAAGDVSPETARMQALAATLTVHRGAVIRMEETRAAAGMETMPRPSSLLEEAWTAISSLAVLLRRSRFAALNMGIQVKADDGARPSDLNVTISPSGARIVLDEATHAAVLRRIPAMTRMTIAGVDQSGRDPVSASPRAPSSTYDLKRLRLTSSVREASEDPMSTMRALAHLELDTMPTISREDER